MRACFFNHRLRVVKLVMQAWVKLVVQRHFLRSIGERISGNHRVMLLGGAIRLWQRNSEAQLELQARLRRGLAFLATDCLPCVGRRGAPFWRGPSSCGGLCSHSSIASPSDWRA